MGEFKFNNITFDEIGKIKLGTENVQKIYNGYTQVFPIPEPIGENEVLIGNLVWTKPNVSETEAGIPIATTEAEAISYLDNDQAACVYFEFDSSNNSRGLLFNKQGAEALTPPDGFRLPTSQDWAKLEQALEYLSGSTDVTNGTGGTPNFLPLDITSKLDFGNSGFDSQGRGWARSNGDTMIFYKTSSEFYWRSISSTNESTPGFSYNGEDSTISFAYQANSNKYAYVRFVRDY